DRRLQDLVHRRLRELLEEEDATVSSTEQAQIIQQIGDGVFGLGPLEPYVRDPEVTEVMVNNSDAIYVERGGKIYWTGAKFVDNEQLRRTIDKIVARVGRRVDESTPYVDARLPDGSRVNAIIEPLAIDGPSLTIRKFPAERITDRDYIDRFGSMTRPMMDFLKVCVEQGLNVIISGGTGSGKTTLLNVLSGFIPTNERIITVEDAAELQLKQDHV